MAGAPATLHDHSHDPTGFFGVMMQSPLPSKVKNGHDVRELLYPPQFTLLRLSFGLLRSIISNQPIKSQSTTEASNHVTITIIVVNDFMEPNLVLNQNHFIAQVNTLYANTIVTRANQLWIRGFANASLQLLFSRIFCSWMCENSLSHENREGRHRMC